MNNIAAIKDQSDFEIYPDYLNIQIDNQFLDELLDYYYPNDDYKGLVPTLIDWLIDEREQKVVWERILPKNNETTICPILMCPDDCDFYCSLVVAQIKRENHILYWEKIGNDQTSSFGADKIGEKVDWFENVKPFQFELSNYQKMLQDFKNVL